jgi:hypothetical protein
MRDGRGYVIIGSVREWARARSRYGWFTARTKTGDEQVISLSKGEMP